MTTPEYFERMYADASDPWQLAEREYERRKFAVTMACLPRPRYSRVFEPGCSIGVLTGLLAERCDELVACDPVEAPLLRARKAVPAPHVSFEVADVPGSWPEGHFDLIVISELLYYLSLADRRDVLQRSAASLTAGGHLVLVHWRHPFDVATCDGDTAHREVPTWTTLVRIVEHVEADFRLEVYAHA